MSRVAHLIEATEHARNAARSDGVHVEPEIKGPGWSHKEPHGYCEISSSPLAGCSRRGSGCVGTESPRGNRTAESRDGPAVRAAQKRLGS